MLEEKNIKKSKGAMFAYFVKKHVARMVLGAGIPTVDLGTNEPTPHIRPIRQLDRCKFVW